MGKMFFSMPFILVAVVTLIVWFIKNHKRIRRYISWFTLTDEAKEDIIMVETERQRLLPLINERLASTYQQLPKQLPACTEKKSKKRK